MNQNAFPGSHIPSFPPGAFPPSLPPQTPGQVVAFPPHLPHPMATVAAAASVVNAAAMKEGDKSEDQVSVMLLKQPYYLASWWNHCFPHNV